MNGRIVALSCGKYTVAAENGAFYNVPARGLFRNKSIKPIVGDNVSLDEINFVINEVEPRISCLKRPPIANIDQMIIVESLTQPDFSYLLAFKYLTYANMNGINAKIVLTKSDRFEDKEQIEEIKKVFEKINIGVFVVSNKNGDGLNEVKKLFENHVTCLIGQTGVGKSSLINAVDPNFDRAVGEYSYALGRGKHQTKEVILLPYSGGYIADTPGFSSLELDLFKEDLAQFYPSFGDRSLTCFYSNCLHNTENKCTVKEAVKNGEIPQIAYDCYLKLLDEAIYKKERY